MTDKQTKAATLDHLEGCSIGEFGQPCSCAVVRIRSINSDLLAALKRFDTAACLDDPLNPGFCETGVHPPCANCQARAAIQRAIGEGR